MARCVSFAGVLLVLTWTALAQSQVLHTLVSPMEARDGRFGVSVAGIGDVDGDGCRDVIVGAPVESQGGHAHIFSGATGNWLRTLLSPDPNPGTFGQSVSAAGDVDDDGCEDVIVGAPGEASCGHAYVFSGATGDTLHTLASPQPQGMGFFGYSVSAAGDVDDDGHDDVLVGAFYEGAWPDPTSAGRAYIFSGATADTLRTFRSPNEEIEGRFGYSVSGAIDVNGDGELDVIVGAVSEGGADEGRAYVFTAGTGALIYTLVSPYPACPGSFGWSVSGVGDANDDGFDDVAIGAVNEFPGPVLAGRAYVFSGASGDTLRGFASPNPASVGAFGCSVSGAGVVNGDGCADVIVGAYGEVSEQGVPDVGHAYIFGGHSGSLLCQLISPNEEVAGHFGCCVDGVGDLNGDGYDDIIVGAHGESPGASPEDAGRAYVFSTMALSGTVSSGELVLDWTPWPGTSSYWVYGADNCAQFDPELSPPYSHRLATLFGLVTAWACSAGVGDVDHNWTYQVVAVNASDQPISVSNRWGEHDFECGAARRSQTGVAQD